VRFSVLRVIPTVEKVEQKSIVDWDDFAEGIPSQRVNGYVL